MAARPPAPPRDPELGAAAAAAENDRRRRSPPRSPGRAPRATQIPPYEAPAGTRSPRSSSACSLSGSSPWLAFAVPGLRDADGDGHRWQVTLARWSIARDYPVISSLAGYAERAERGGGIEAYLPEADTTNEVFLGAGAGVSPGRYDDRTRRIWKISTRGR